MTDGLALELLDPEALLQGEDFLAVRNFLNTPRHRNLGWHYIVDLVWIYARANNWSSGGTVLDVGGGAGPAQFLLAEMGFKVFNLDLFPMRVAPWMRQRYRTAVSTSRDYSGTQYVDHLKGEARHWSALARRDPRGLTLGVRDSVSGWITQRHYNRWRTEMGIAAPVGMISAVAANICKVADFPSASFDAVVSLSAIEHIPFDQLPQCIGEIRRLLKPGGRMAITTSATDKPDTWFHEPSRGLCFSLEDAERIFRATNRSGDSAAEVLARYRRNDYLRRNLARFYFKSGRNGMPFGEWSPSYVPIGIGD